MLTEVKGIVKEYESVCRRINHCSFYCSFVATLKRTKAAIYSTPMIHQQITVHTTKNNIKAINTVTK